MVCPTDDDDPAYRPTSSDWAAMVGSQRGDQYTPMGQIEMMGDFLSSAKRPTRLKPWLIPSVVVLVAFAALIGVVAFVTST